MAEKNILDIEQKTIKTEYKNKHGKGDLIEGEIVGNERGYGFLVTGDGQEDYFIPHSDLRGAMHGDRVLCQTTSGTGNRTTARVLKILKRGIEELVGTFYTFRKGGFITPDDRRYFTDIFVPLGKVHHAKTGDKVICKIECYPLRKSPEGRVTKVLGRQFDRKAELLSIMHTYKLPQEFSPQVLNNARQVAKPVSKQDLVDRQDFRNLTTFTIDGDDSRDFDDAVSIEKLKGEKLRLGVHIADVTHYVSAFSPLDKEAFSRGTSTYFPESVIPMLPTMLSNGICSLNEGEDRLTLSCIMTIDKRGKVVDSYITPAVINSKARLTYSKVQRLIDCDFGKSNEITKEDKELAKTYSHLLPSLKMMNELSDLLIKVRECQGNIDLDVKESTVTVLGDGKIHIEPTKRDKAHKIIEEFMILANTTVAEFMFYLEQPFIYRVHGKPIEEKLDGFYEFLKGLGINVKRRKDEVYSKDFQTILKNAENTPYFSLINRVMLRSMQKAVYSPNDVGHFGLSLSHYCHFTSPIRRYPDLAIHRIIKDFLRGEENLDVRYGEFVAKASKQSSLKEKNSAEAERAVDDYYKILYISNHEGEEFNGIISGVTSFGIFVELDNCIEGLVKVETLNGNGYRYDQKRYTLSNGKDTYKLGQQVKIKVAGVNIMSRRAEFLLLEQNAR